MLLLLSASPPQVIATCKQDGTWQVLDVALLVPGNTVMLGKSKAWPVLASY